MVKPSDWLPGDRGPQRPRADWIDNPNVNLYRFSVRSPALAMAIAIGLAGFAMLGIVAGSVLVGLGSTEVGLGLLLPSAIVVAPIAVAGIAIARRRYRGAR